MPSLNETWNGMNSAHGTHAGAIGCAPNQVDQEVLKRQLDAAAKQQAEAYAWLNAPKPKPTLLGRVEELFCYLQELEHAQSRTIGILFGGDNPVAPEVTPPPSLEMLIEGCHMRAACLLRQQQDINGKLRST